MTVPAEFGSAYNSFMNAFHAYQFFCVLCIAMGIALLGLFWRIGLISDLAFLATRLVAIHKPHPHRCSEPHEADESARGTKLKEDENEQVGKAFRYGFVIDVQLRPESLLSEVHSRVADDDRR